ncbi:hypothetical protein V8F20_007390 [Naviculisporaceae sp. PSN 640]
MPNFKRIAANNHNDVCCCARAEPHPLCAQIVQIIQMITTRPVRGCNKHLEPLLAPHRDTHRGFLIVILAEDSDMPVPKSRNLSNCWGVPTSDNMLTAPTVPPRHSPFGIHVTFSWVRHCIEVSRGQPLQEPSTPPIPHLKVESSMRPPHDTQEELPICRKRSSDKPAINNVGHCAARRARASGGRGTIKVRIIVPVADREEQTPKCSENVGQIPEAGFPVGFIHAEEGHCC